MKRETWDKLSEKRKKAIKKRNSDYFWARADLIAALLFIHMKKIVIAIIVIAFILANTIFATDPIDEKGERSHMMVMSEKIHDNEGYGFMVCYYTVNEITEARRDEIQKRKSLKDQFSQVREEALSRFGSFKNVDIYDFTDFIYRKKINEKEMRLILVFASGKLEEECRIEPEYDESIVDIWGCRDAKRGVMYVPSYCIRKPKDEPRVYAFWLTNESRWIRKPEPI